MKTNTRTPHSTRLLALASCLLLCAALPAMAQAPAKIALAKQMRYDTTKNGLIYKMYTHATGPKATEGGIMMISSSTNTIKDSLIASSPDGFIPMGKIQKRGDPMELLYMLSAGDSTSFLLSIDSMIQGGASIPPPFKHGDYLKINLKVKKIMTKDEYDKMQQAEQQKAMQASAQEMENYIKTHNLKAQKTASGLYYVIDTPGDGPQAQAGKKVKVNYTGALLDGTVFDSSLKPGRQPFEFNLGQGQVIKGWDEGIALFKKGGKGKLIIPSNLGYGAQGAPPSIPANATLVFDIEVLDVQ